eukprot:6175401-Pleurochrysis_carterae.AAC.1
MQRARRPGRRRRVLGVLAELVEESAQVRCFFGSFRSCDDFGFARRECHRRLFLLLQVMAACPYMNTWPDVECRVAQSESENPVRGVPSERA